MMNRQMEHRALLETTLCDTVMMNTYHTFVTAVQNMQQGKNVQCEQ